MVTSDLSSAACANEGRAAFVPMDKLHLAASRFERLPREVTSLICRPGWVHLGEPPLDVAAEVREHWSSGRWYGALKTWAAGWYRNRRPRYTADELKQLYEVCEFRPFHFTAGGRLDFEDSQFEFVFSEHFFEHLFLDEAVALFRECFRIMKPGGIIRTSVPDADLRNYCAIEPAGYPSPRVPWGHHQKHKSRWSVYSLSEVLRQTGFEPRPVMWCDRDGQFHKELPDGELTGTLAYLRRMPSLIVDGIKPSVSQ